MMKKEIKVDINKHFTEQNNPYNWRQGCEFCKNRLDTILKYVKKR